MKEGEVIESGMLTRQIEKAQRKVESHNFDIRKQLLLFDDVANDQRKVVYQQRTEIMGTEDLSGAVAGCARKPSAAHRPVHAQAAVPLETGTWPGSTRRSQRTSTRAVDPKAWLAAEPELEEQALRDASSRRVAAPTRRRWRAPAREIMRHVEKEVMLQMLDQHWREHLAAMDYLRQGIHLRGYAQKDYRFEYKREAFELFAAMLDRVKFETVSFLAKIEIRTQEEIEREEEERRERLMRALQAQHAEAQSVFTAAEAASPGAAGGLVASHLRAGAGCGAAGHIGGRAPVLESLPHPSAGSQVPFVRERAQSRAQRALPLRLGQEVQALPRRALERPVRSARAGAAESHVLVVAAALYDARRADPDRRAARRQNMAGRWEFPGGKVDAGGSRGGCARSRARTRNSASQSVAATPLHAPGSRLR